jgi:hypothetical protein
MLNTIALSLNRYPMDNLMEIDVMRHINGIAMSFFIFELGIKLIGYGFKEFFKETINIVDFVVILSGVV